MMANNTQYGLILPKKQQTTTSRFGNVFGDDNASDEDDGTDWVKKSLKAEGEKSKMKKQTKLDIQKALNEDPTIYQYDEVYDDMERSKNKLDISKQKDKKSKYIQNLLKTAERRKKEQEHRIERMVQKEREAEGDMYADKESFVTSAYRIKLEEFKKMEEEEARMNRLETIGDATKQQDMSGFYRHLYEQTVDYKGDNNEDRGDNIKEKNTEQKKRKNSTDSLDKEQENITINETLPTDKRLITKSKKSRQYRQRAYESDSENDTNKDLEKNETIVSPVNKDIDISKVQEPGEKKQKLEKDDTITRTECIIDTKDEVSNVNNENLPQNDINIVPESEVENKEKGSKNKTSIWEKRTVGLIFEAALQRYYIRKTNKLTAGN